MDLNSTDRLNAARGRRKTSTISNSILHEFGSVYIDSALDDIQEERFTFKEALPQIFASASVTSFHVILGVTFAATATLIPRILSKDNDFVATKAETALIASIFVLSVPPTALLAGYCMDQLGRLNTVKMSILPAVGSCVLIALASNSYMIIGGRCLMGIATAFGTNPAVVYITESTSSEYRGSLVSAGPTLSSLGMMLGYLMGALLPWRTVSWVNITFVLIPILLITFCGIPESPAWLMSKGRHAQARQSLAWLARWKTYTSREKYIEERLAALKKVTNSSGENKTFYQKLSGLRKPSGYRPLIIFIILFTFQQYCGVYITTFFAVQFFEGAGSSMDPFLASVGIGMLRFVFSVVTTVLLKHFRRRSMCLVSTMGMAFFMATSGYFTYQVKQTGESSIVPVICILLYVAFSMVGLLSLPWTMAAEVFPNEIRAIGHGMVIGMAHIAMFVSIQTYYDMVDFFGGYEYLQWFFAVMSVLATVFIYFCLPETHDRQLSDIQEYFENNAFYPGKVRKPKAGAGPAEGKNGNSGIPRSASAVEVRAKLSRQADPKALEALEECDTLLYREEQKHATIIPSSDSKVFIGNTDTSKLDFIDKSMELLSGTPRVQPTPTADFHSQSVPDSETNKL